MKLRRLTRRPPLLHGCLQYPQALLQRMQDKMQVSGLQVPPRHLQARPAIVQPTVTMAVTVAAAKMAARATVRPIVLQSMSDWVCLFRLISSSSTPQTTKSNISLLNAHIRKKMLTSKILSGVGLPTVVVGLLAWLFPKPLKRKNKPSVKPIPLRMHYIPTNGSDTVLLLLLELYGTFWWLSKLHDFNLRATDI